MIRVDKSKALPPNILAAEKGGGRNEADQAIKFYQKLIDARAQATPAAPAPADGKKPAAGRKKASEKKFKFSVYGDVTVREVLEQLFNHKCAYCESRYAGTQPVDVEHWRPKARVDVEDGEQELDLNYGYYWLAANWSNLLPSCIDCNRRRTQELASDGTKRTVGKGNRFPLAPGSKRATVPGEEQFEQPLLLNPCVDDPEQHLEFLDVGVVRPKLDPESKQPSAKGRASIEVYALNRTALVQDRREVLLLIQQRMHIIVSLLQVLDTLPTERPEAQATPATETIEPRRELVEDLLSHELENLYRFRDPDRPFSLMAQQIIDAFIDSLISTRAVKER